jgi:hypothetical protein
MNILDNEIKSLSLDTIKLTDIFTKYNNININSIQNNYKNNKLFKKFITLSIRLNLKLFKIVDDKYKLKDNNELLEYTKKLRKVLLKKYAIHILKYLLEDHDDIINHIDMELSKLKKYFLYIEMYEYLIKNVFNGNQLESMCFNDESYGNINVGKLECISTNSTDISFDSNIQLNMGSYISYKSDSGSITGNVTDTNIYLSQSKGKLINISLKNYIAEYSN